MTKSFVRFVRKEGISDGRLIDAVHRAQQGLIDAHLGGCVVKQRIARPRQHIWFCQKRSGEYQRMTIGNVARCCSLVAVGIWRSA
jgi:hypothetical protein